MTDVPPVAPPPSVESTYWAIVDARGGEDAFSDEQKNVAWRYAELLCSKDNAQSWKAEDLKALLPPEVSRNAKGTPPPIIPDDATLAQAQRIFKTLCDDGKDSKGNAGGDFQYDYSLDTGIPEWTPEQQEALVAQRLQEAKRNGVELTRKNVEDALFVAQMGEQDLEHFVRVELREETLVDPTTIDLTSSTPVLGNEQHVIRPPPRPPLHTREELAQATPNPTETAQFAQPRRERMQSKRDSQRPSAAQSTEARQAPTDTPVPIASYTPLSEREPTAQQAKIDEQYSRMRSGMNNHSDTFRPPRRGMS